MATGTELSMPAGLSNGATTKENADGGTTILGREDALQGRLVMRGGGHLLGKFQGEIDCVGELMVGKEAEVSANIRSANVTISGLVRGNVYVTGRLKLTSSGRLEGDARVASLVVQEGAVHLGSIEVHPEGLSTDSAATSIVLTKRTEPEPVPGPAPGPRETTPTIDRVKKFWGEFF